MADTDVWGLGGPIASPAATDRAPWATGPGAGGYSLRGDFVYRDAATGKFIASGADTVLRIDQTAATATPYGLELGGGGQVDGYFKSALTTGEIRIGAGRHAAWGGHLTFYTDTVERMRITSTGNVGLGTIPEARFHVVSTGEVARFASTTPRGGGSNFITLYDPSGRKGYWGYGGSDDRMYLMNEMSGALMLGNNATFRVVIDGFSVRPQDDNVLSLGASAARWSVVYAATGTINTCDVRLKFYRAEPAPTLDEHAAALECFAAFGFFQHLDAREREADGGAAARWHFGPKAQEVWAIFASHGLAAPLGEEGLPPVGSVPPAFLCFDTWGEETAPVMAWWRPSGIIGVDGEPIMVPCAEGEEGTEQRPTGETYVTREAGNIFGIRIDQLQSLMLVAIRKEQLAQAAEIAAQAARISALEAAA